MSTELDVAECIKCGEATVPVDVEFAGQSAPISRLCEECLNLAFEKHALWRDEFERLLGADVHTKMANRILIERMERDDPPWGSGEPPNAESEEIWKRARCMRKETGS